MSEVKVLGLSTDNLPAFGEVLHNQFVGHKDYKALWMPKIESNGSWTTEYIKNVKDAIADIYKKIGLPGYPDQGEFPSPIRVGDVLEISSNNHVYVVTAYTQQFIRTFPSYTSEDEKYFEPRSISKLFAIRRPPLSSINFSKYETVVKEELPQELIEDRKRFGGTFKATTQPADSTHLQIGDLIFNVDPIQISFTTQNGFQYFPTIRTNGNPKLPTQQQIKNMNIVLIFPNEDAINYQLLPLYAMFRRTPFVNIKNRDICNIYEEIKSSGGYIPVALESIQIQSIEGFPNSLQATISLLPFEPGLINNGELRVLKSFDDVYIQQKNREAGSELEYLIQLSDRKMQEESISSIPTRFEKLTEVVIDHTENFRESFPFRAFYQSLIAENKVVKNEYGKEEALFGDKDSAKISSDISYLAPVNKDNALHYYNSEANRAGIAFTYQYLKFFGDQKSGDLRNIGKYISEERIKSTDDRLNWFHKTMNNLTDWKAIPLAMFSAFPNIADAIRPFDYQFGKMDQLINTVLVQHGFETATIKAGTGGTVKDVGVFTVLGFLFKNLLYNTGIPQAWNNAQSVLKAAQQANGQSSTPDMTANEAWALIGKNVTYTDANFGALSEYGIHTIQGAFISLWEFIKDDEQKKRDFILILEDIAKAIRGELTQTIEVRTLGDTPSDTEYYVKYLPIDTNTIEIDNKYDVITSWSLTYANKFIPINLIAYKYPFYQHIGSEDATLSLAVTSVPAPSMQKKDLKAQLTEMSDKIYDSVKLINYTAPDLYTWMDPRVGIDAPAGHIFHAFGIRKVVVNSSNSTNIQGQPDSWNTVINLTQANFSVEQYHNIEAIPTTSQLEAIIAGLLPRIVLLDDGKFSVKKFSSQEKVLTLDDLLTLSFFRSKAGGRWWAHLVEVLGKNVTVSNINLEDISKRKDVIGEQLLQQIIPGMKEISKINFDEEDTDATAELRAACANNRKFEQLLKAIVKEFNGLLDRQGEVFENLIDKHKTILYKVCSVLKPIVAGGTVGAGINLLIKVAFSAIPGTNVISIVGGLSTLIPGVVDSLKDIGIDIIKDDYGWLIQKMITVYKKEMILQLSHAIAKDPPIRKRLLSPAIVNLTIPPTIVGDTKVPFNVDQALKERESFGRINCYKDFDIPLTWTIDGRSVRASPDFYLYNHSDPLYYAQSYIKDSTERMLKAARRGVQMTLIEHEELLKKFDNILSEIGGSGNFEEILFGITDNEGKEVKEGIATQLGYINRNLEDSRVNVAQRYRIAVLQGEGAPNSTTAQEENKITISDDRKKILETQWEVVNSGLLNTNKPLYDEQKKAFDYFLQTGVSPKVAMDSQRLNLVWTARMRCLLELVEMSLAIRSYYANISITNPVAAVDEKSRKEIAKKLNLEDSETLLSNLMKERLSQLNDVIFSILKDWNTVSTESINKKSGDDQKLYKPLLEKQMSKGLSATPISKDAKLSIPSIRVLENELYNKIGYYIRLNSAIIKYNETGKPVSLDELPELQMLDVWNLRTTESSIRQLEIEKQYFESLKRQNAPTLKFFPTFKIYFIEEDTGRTSLMDDFYAYNAVQTIEISKNRNSSSSVAVLRLNNLTGTFTDKLSFHRERSDFLTQKDPFNTADEAFFGTLDIKPGTKVQIKLGYAADERYLPTVFTGRILEMNVGPVTEIICQSYGAQLQHKIYTAKFGFFASEKEYGDIASALLDMIPGLENLGKKDIVNFGLLGGFTGREASKIRKNLFDNFLLTNLLGKLTADIKSVNNPRDENIFLPFNLSLYAPDKPRFDWVVYNQSVWSALQEICLYVMNTNPLIKQFNNDPFSNRNEQRETLIIGNKSGYYKYTDSLSLSSLDTDGIEQAVKQFDDIRGKGLLNEPALIKISQDTEFKWEPTLSDMQRSLKLVGLSKILNAFGIPDLFAIFFSNYKYELGTMDSPGEKSGGLLNPKWIDFWKFLSNPVNVNILKKRLLQKIDISIKQSWQFVTQGLDKQLQLGIIGNWHASKCITALDKFSNDSIEEDPINHWVSEKYVETFSRIVYHMTALNTDNFWSLSADEFYGVSAEINNVNPALASDPRYKKIQQHYLVTDSTNLINNSISLNSAFANMVNLYYLDEPQFINGIDGVPPDKFEKLNVWTIKAFGDIKDEHARPLDTFQKNVDPWWFDIAEKHGSFFKGFRRLNYNSMGDAPDKTGKSESEQKTNSFKSYIETLNSGPFNLHIPDWRAFPSFQIVGVNLLKKQVEQMYRGSIQIVGDCSIEPMDLIHIEDYINDLHGVVEADEVVHTFTPDGGLITTITPAMITYDRDPIQHEDVGIINRIFNIAQTKSSVTWGKTLFGGGATLLGGVLALRSNPIFWSGIGALGALSTVNGLKSLVGQEYHKFLYEQMGNIIGRDVLNFTALLYHGMPYMCGFDGVDYTSLKTLMVHKVEDIENPIARITAFSDPFAASIYTNFNPANFDAGKAIAHSNLLEWIMGYPTHGRLNDAFTVWNRMNPLGGG